MSAEGKASLGPIRRTILPPLGRLSRAAHRTRYLGRRGSQGVRFISGKLANAGTYSYRDVGGHLVEADLADYMERAGFFGAHSASLVRLVTGYLSDGDWAIDAGANVGLISSPMCTAVGPTGSIWAFEPLPRNVDRLQRLKAVNGLTQLQIFAGALSDGQSVESLRLPDAPGGSGWGSFVATWPTAGEIEVPTWSLDALVRDEGAERRLRLIKIDVEGFEQKVMLGAQETLERHRPIIVCEVHDGLLKSAGSSAEGLLDWFAGQGYVPREPFGRPRGSLDGCVLDVLLIPSER